MRKNCLLFVAIAAMALLFNACSNEEIWEDATPKVEEEAEGGEMGTKAAETKYKFLGCGYDVTGIYLDDTSVRGSVIDIKKFIATYDSSYVNYITGTKSHEEYYYGYNSSDYIKEIKKKSGYDANASYKIDSTTANIDGEFSANFSKSSDFSSKETYSSEYSFAHVDIKHRNTIITLNEIRLERLRTCLTKSFMDHLNSYSPDDLITEYGTHVLCDIHMGGIVRITYRSSITDESNSTRKKEALKGGLNVRIMGIGLGGNANKESEKYEYLANKNRSEHLVIQTTAGKGPSGSYDLSKGIPSVTLKDWYDSVDREHASLIYINWEKAYPIYELASDPVKKQQLKEAAERYIKSKELEMLESLEKIPVYSIWDPHNNNCFYSSSYSDFLGYPTTLGMPKGGDLQKHGIGFRILAKEYPNTVPLYRMYHEWGKNHIYLSAGTTSELYDYMTWTKYQRTEGYVYKTYQPGTIKVYGFYHADTPSPNCILLADPSDSQINDYSSWAINNGIAFYAYPAY